LSKPSYGGVLARRTDGGGVKNCDGATGRGVEEPPNGNRDPIGGIRIVIQIVRIHHERLTIRSASERSAGGLQAFVGCILEREREVAATFREVLSRRDAENPRVGIPRSEEHTSELQSRE